MLFEEIGEVSRVLKVRAVRDVGDAPTGALQLRFGSAQELLAQVLGSCFAGLCAYGAVDVDYVHI